MADPGDERRKAETGTSADDRERDRVEHVEREVVPVVEEEAEVGVRRFQTGSVRVRTEPFERQEHVEAQLERTDVEVERVEVGREVDDLQPIREEGDVTVVPLHEEVLVVRKQLVVKEELHIRRQTSSRTENLDVTLRGERPIIERTGPDDHREPGNKYSTDALDQDEND